MKSPDSVAARSAPAPAAVTLPELVEARAGRDPERVALCLDGRDRLTIGDWLARARPVAAGLARDGVRTGDRVSLLFADDAWLDYAVAALAVYLAGGAVVGLSARLGAAESGRRSAAVGAAGLIHGAGVDVPAGPGWRVSSSALAAGSGPVSSRPAISPVSPISPISPDGLAEIIHTSGTTGPAKAVAVTHANLTFGQDAAMDRVAGPAGGVLTPVPLGTNAGHSAVLAALTSAATVHVLSRPDARSAAEAVARLRLPGAILPAPLARAMVAQELVGPYLSGLRTLMLGSAPVHTATASRLRALLPDTAVSIGYGSTEAAPAFTQLPSQDWEKHPGSLGLPRPGADVRIAGPDGSPAGPGAVGEIWLRCPGPQRSYFGRPADGTFQDGWTRMGDLGSVDEDGYLYFFDRAADAVSAADGRLVSTYRIEDVLLDHPEIADAAVVADRGGAPGAVAAFVQPRTPGAPPPPDRLRGFLADRLSEAEVPARIVTVDELPRGPLGKILKRRLA